MPRFLGIDYGQKRIGTAVSDPTAEFAFPLETIVVKSQKQVFARLRQICERDEVSELVIGLPLNMDGTEGPMAEEVRKFAERSTRRLDRPVHFWDERLSSAEAEGALLEAKLRRNARRDLRDKLAAQIILQSYLDANRKSDRPGTPGD